MPIFFNTKSEEKKGEKPREKKRKKSAPFGEQKNLICFTLKSFFLRQFLRQFFATVCATVFLSHEISLKKRSVTMRKRKNFSQLPGHPGFIKEVTEVFKK
mgnify:CR=1 FL=1